MRCSVVSDSLWSHGLWPASLLCPWDSLGKNTGAGFHFLLQKFSELQVNEGSSSCLSDPSYVTHWDVISELGTCNGCFFGCPLWFSSKFYDGIVAFISKERGRISVDLGRALRFWQNQNLTPAHHIETDIQLRTSLLFKTEELWGRAGGQEVVLLASSMQAFRLVSVSLQSPSFLLLADPKWFRITGRSRIFFSPQAEYYWKCKHSKLSHSSLVAENPIVRSWFESSEGGAGRGARTIMATKF